jgi:hypothetical protein
MLVFCGAVVALSQSGCGAGNYFRNRAGDLSDVLQGELGWPAIGVYAEVTPLLHTGLDFWRAFPAWGGTAGTFRTRAPEQSEFFGYSVLLWHARDLDTDPAARDPEDLESFPPTHAGTLTHVHELGHAFDDRPCPDVLRPLHWLDVEVDAALGLGVRLRFSPGELLDFLLGWFGADLGGDDAPREPAAEGEEET